MNLDFTIFRRLNRSWAFFIRILKSANDELLRNEYLKSYKKNREQTFRSCPQMIGRFILSALLMWSSVLDDAEATLWYLSQRDRWNHFSKVWTTRCEIPRLYGLIHNLRCQFRKLVFWRDALHWEHIRLRMTQIERYPGNAHRQVAVINVRTLYKASEVGECCRSKPVRSWQVSIHSLYTTVTTMGPRKKQGWLLAMPDSAIIRSSFICGLFLGFMRIRVSRIRIYPGYR